LLRELLLIKLRSNEEVRGKINELANVYKAKVIDVSVSSIVLELTGEPERVDEFLNSLSGIEILEMCRTCVTAMERGEVSYLIEE
jgi:acetolactate synthase-1/3 small subunit